MTSHRARPHSLPTKVGIVRSALPGAPNYESCRRKVPYPNRRAARQGAARAMKAHGGAALGIYQCRACNGWHLTKRVEGHGAAFIVRRKGGA